MVENGESDMVSFLPPNMPKPPIMVNGASPADMAKE